MKKIYLIIVAVIFLSANKIVAQCSVNISSNPGSTQLNCNTASIILTADTTGTKGLVSFTWSTGEISASINVSVAANYAVTIRDTSGCSSSSSINITSDIIAPVVKILPFPDTICSGGSATLVAIGAVSYSWLPGLQTVNPLKVNPAITTTYTVTGTAANGCTGKDSFELVVNQLPTAAIGGTVTVCQNSAQPAVSFAGLSGKKPFTFIYDINGGPRQIISTTGNNTIVLVNAPTEVLVVFTYNLISVTDSNGCIQSQNGTAIIKVEPGPALTSAKSASICDNGLFNYTAVSSVTGTSFSWARAVTAGISNPSANGTTATISESLDNTTSQPVVVNYIFTLSTGTGCVTTEVVQVTVTPTPVTNPIADKTYCNGVFVIGGIPFTSSSPGAAFTWTNSNTTIGLAATGNGSIPAFIATNTGGGAITATITIFIKASADSCAGTSTSFTITVLPAPVLTSAKTASSCDNAAYTYNATSSAAVTNFSWIRAVVPGITNPASSGTSATIIETLDNNSSQPVIVNYVFTLSTGTGCITTDSVKVTINPTPATDLVSNKTYCNGAFVSSGIPFTSSSPGAAFTWTNSNPSIGLPLSGRGSIPAFIATNTSGSSINATITVSVKASADSCAGATINFTITVLPAPVLTSAKTASICDNKPFSYLAVSSATGTIFSWTRAAVSGISNQSASGNLPQLNETLENTTSQPQVVQYVFTLTTGTGCITTDSVKVTVNPTPVIDAITNKSYCNGEFVIGGIPFTSSSPGAVFTWTNSNTTIGLPATGNGSIPAFIATNTGGSSINATISVFVKASADSCAGTNISFSITVLPAPILTSAKTASICDNKPFNYTATSSATGTSFSWTRAAVSGISNQAASGNLPQLNETLDNTTSQPQVVKYVFILTTGTGCITTDSVKVTVNPTPVIDAITNKSYCNGEFVIGGIPFTSSSPGTAFTWTNSNPNIGLPPSGTGSIPPFNAKDTTDSPITATITVSITASADNCPGSDSTFTITVFPGPVLTSLKTASVCDNKPFNYTATSSAIGTNFNWRRDAVAGISNPASSGSTAIIIDTLYNLTTQPVIVKYLFSLSIGTGCITKDSVLVTVNPTPVINSITNKKYCNGEFVTGGIPFTSSSPGAAFTWSNSNPNIGLPLSGSGSIPPFNAKDTTDSPITATIRVSITASADNCAGPDSIFIITVLPTPILSSRLDTSICDNTLFSYIATSSATSTNFQWSRDAVAGISNASSSGSTATINETLDNNSAQPVDVYYVFTLSAGSGCTTTDSVKVTVNPTPVINTISDKAYCNDSLVQQINFTSLTNSALFSWTCNPSIGFGASGTGPIPAFNTNNQSDTALIGNVMVKISVDNDKCMGNSIPFKMNVFPTPYLTSRHDTSICDNTSFAYTATSSAIGIPTNFIWTRAAVTGISNPPGSGTIAAVNETLDNTTSQPALVKYVFKLSVGSDCVTYDTVRVTVNPTPVLNPIIAPPPFCNGIPVQPISFSCTSPNAAFTWISDTTIGFGFTGRDSIPAFIASNTGRKSINATITVKVTASSDYCIGPDLAFRIIVNPSPPKPNFTSFSRYPDNEVLTVCSGTENINFNVNSPDAGLSYLWTAIPDNPAFAIIKSKNQPNTAISFRNSGLGINSINLLATDSLTCSNSASQNVQVSRLNGIEERKIFLKQPGNLLIYPDNSLNALNGYQWGYDSLLQSAPAPAYGVPIPVTGQVYQTFIPAIRFIKNGQLDTVNRAFWVLLQQGTCNSRVYYNGPFARSRSAIIPPADNTVQLKIIPNPNNGNFQIHLQGNIYGSMEVKIYNTVGQLVLKKVFIKNTSEINEKINALHFAKGLYFLVVNGSDLKKVVSRFIIQ